MKKLLLFGASGSIGASTLSILRDHPGLFRLVGLSVHSNTTDLERWIAEFNPGRIAISNPASRAKWLAANPNHADRLLPADADLTELLNEPADIVLNGLLGFAGLHVTLGALERDIDVALANKESLVCGGDVLLGRLKASSGRLLPVDSEHSGVWRLLAGVPRETVRRVILTASGGPFQHCDAKALAAVTPAQALDHPTWKMGPKITVDSATLMNKGLEVIEASLLFGIPADRIDVLVHPSSTVHALIETTDSAIYSQMSRPDMRQPILHALLSDSQIEAEYGRLDLTQSLYLEFHPLDEKRFPAVALARTALERGGTAPLALNAADEIAVAAFLDGQLGFTDIVSTVGAVLSSDEWSPAGDYATLAAADERARDITRDHIGQLQIGRKV